MKLKVGHPISLRRPNALRGLSRRRRFTSNCQNTHAVSEKGCSLWNVRYAVLSSGRGMCQQIRHHRKILGGVSTLKGIQNFFYERPRTGGGSTSSISTARNSKMDHFATIRKSLIRPLYSPEIVQGCAMRVYWLVSAIWSVAGRPELAEPEFPTCKYWSGKFLIWFQL